MSFMINFIDTLKHFELPTWNEYVGGGHPAMYFAHYPITQNTLIYMLLGFNDLTYYFTKFTSTVITLLSFVYACRLFKIDYLTALLGAVVYFCINFVVRIIVAETIGNLVVLYPVLVMLAIHLVAENRQRQRQEVLIFILCFIFWLLGNNLTYVHIHAVMLSVVYWLTAFIYHRKTLDFSSLKNFITLYLVMFIFPWIAVLYQYYFVLDVVASCNRLKEGLVVSPSDLVVWKQLFSSFISSSYFWIGLFSSLLFLLIKVFSGNNIFSRVHHIKQDTGNILLIGAAALLLVITITKIEFTFNSVFLMDYVALFNSAVFRIALLIYLSVHTFLKSKKYVSILTLRDSFIFIIYMSLLSYYFYSPDNINESGAGKGYDYALFRELSALSQVIFTLSMLFAIEDCRKNKIVKVMILSLIVLYFIRSHFSIPILRFTGIIWYATRDGSIFSVLFAIIFMFGLKNMIFCFSKILSLVHVPFHILSKPGFTTYFKHGFLLLLVLLMVNDSYDKLYKGTSHRFIYPQSRSIVKTPEEKHIVDAREEIVSLNDKLISLNKRSDHFYRFFTPENNIYLAGTLQDHKIYEAAIYDSAISKQFQDFYDNIILQKKPFQSRELKDVMPYHLFTRHFYEGVHFKYNDVAYIDFFVFSPKDTENIKNQNIEFFWDIMQVKYLIVGSTFSAAMKGFTNYNHNYELLDKYPALGLNLYEITKNKNYSRFAVLPLEKDQCYDEMVKKMNSSDINVLKSIYPKLVFLDETNPDFNLVKIRRDRKTRYYEIEATKEAIFIEFESWNHNWELKINNEFENLPKVFHIFKGIKIKPGMNTIDITYNLKYFEGLFFLSIFVSVLYAVLLVGFHHSGTKKQKLSQKYAQIIS